MMFNTPRLLCAGLLGLAVALALGAQALAANTVTLAPPEKLSGKTLALPRLAGPASPMTTKINTALGKVDASWVAFIKDCKSQAPTSETNRTAGAPMLGPRYFSVVARYDYDCGGAYPDTGTLALVYDLTTGRPVNWAKLMPAPLVQTSSVDTNTDGTSVGSVASERLSAFYRKALPAALAKANDVDKADRASCADALGDSLTFFVWPDAARDGVVIFPSSLAHAVKACGPEVLIPAASLRKMGADRKFVDAIEAAHAAKAWK
jgi:hypothetical protein